MSASSPNDRPLIFCLSAFSFGIFFPSVLAPCSHHPAGQSFSGRPKCEAVNETPQCSTSCDNQQDYNQDKSFGASAYGQSQGKLSGGPGGQGASATS